MRQLIGIATLNQLFAGIPIFQVNVDNRVNRANRADRFFGVENRANSRPFRPDVVYARCSIRAGGGSWAGRGRLQLPNFGWVAPTAAGPASRVGHIAAEFERLANVLLRRGCGNPASITYPQSPSTLPTDERRRHIENSSRRVS